MRLLLSVPGTLLAACTSGPEPDSVEFSHASEERVVPVSDIPGVSWNGNTIVGNGLPLDVDLLDPRLINAVLEHALNSGRVSSRDFYQGDDPSRVLFRRGQLPDEFLPEVPGIEFIPWSGDDPETGEGYLVVSYTVPSPSGHDLAVGMSNVGGGTEPDGTHRNPIGGSDSYYGVDRTGDVLRVTYVGTFDP